MPKYYYMPKTDSVQSIDITKSEGLSYFWSLFSRSNKKGNKQAAENNEKGKFKLNVALKLLKLKGIDLTNIDSFVKNEHLLQKNSKVMIIKPNQVKVNKKDCISGNVVWTEHNYKIKPKSKENSESNDIPLEANPVKSKTELKKSSVTHLNSKKPNIYAFSDKNVLLPNGKNDKTFKQLSSSLSGGDNMLNIGPEGKIKKKRRKTVLVPVYVGKKKSDKSNNSEGYTLNIHRQDENLDASSITSKMKPMKAQQNNLKYKSKENRSVQFDSSKLITTRGRVNYKLSESEPKKLTSNNDDWYIYSNNSPANHCQNTSFGDCLGDEKNEKEKNNQEVQNFVSILCNPDILIKNHNLNIPRDLSQESLFQANPSAGCDTIMKLFNVLTQKGNQLKNITDSSSNENIQERRQTKKCDTEKLSKFDNIRLESVKETDEYTKNGTYNNSMNASRNQENSPTKFPGRRLEDNECVRTSNEFKSIFSLPVDVNTLKLLNYKRFSEKKNKFEEVASKADTSKFLDKVVEESSDVSTSDSENKQTICMSKEIKASSQNLQTNVSQTLCDYDKAKVKNGFEKFSVESSMINKTENSKFSESELNEMMIEQKENNLDLVSKNSFTAHEQKEERRRNLCHKISIETTTSKSNEMYYNMNMNNLNISHEQCTLAKKPEHPQKLLKKTTISCPVKSPNQKVSITILFEKNRRDGRQNERGNSRLNNHTLPPLRGSQHSHSSLGAINEQKVIEEEQKEQVIEEEQKEQQVIEEEQKEQQVIEEEQKDREKNKYSEVEPKGVNSLPDVKSISSSKSKIAYRSIHSSACRKKQFRQNEKSELFELTSNATYLTKERRKTFDTEVLRVSHNERSINLSSLKSPHYKKTLTNLEYESFHVNILSESNAGCQESRSRYRTNTKHFRQTSHVSGSRDQGDTPHTECLSDESRPETKIIQQDNPFNANNETKNLPLVSASSNMKIYSPLKSNNEFINDQQFFKPQIKSCLSENSVHNNLKKRTYRSGLTLNEESLEEQTRNNSPFLKCGGGIIPKRINKNEKIEESSDVKSANNYNQPDLSSLVDTTHFNCMPSNEIVYKTVMCVQPGFNENFFYETKKYTGPHFCNATIIPTEETALDVAQRPLENIPDGELEKNCSKSCQSSLLNEKIEIGVPKTFSNHENKSMQQNDFQNEQILNPEGLINDPIAETGVENNNTLKLPNYKRFSEKRNKFEEVASKADTSKFLDKVVEEPSAVSTSDSENKQTIYMSKEIKASSQNLQTNVSQTLCDYDKAKVKNSFEKFSVELSMNNSDGFSSKSDVKLTYQNSAKNLCSQIRFDEIVDNSLQDIKESAKFSTNKAKQCYTFGCLTIPDSWSDDCEEH